MEEVLSESEIIETGEVQYGVRPLQINFTDYEIMQCVIDVNNLDELSFNLRDVNIAWKDELKIKIRRHSFIPTSGNITVVNVMSSSEVEMDERTITGRVKVVDGRHRSRALKELDAEEDTSTVVKEFCRNLPVTKMHRKDGKVISWQEAFHIAAVLNESCGSVLKMSFSDRVYACVSYILSLEADKIVVDDLNIATTTKLLEGVAFMKNLASTTRKRYAQIAICMAKCPEAFKCFKEITLRNPCIGVTHLSSNKLLQSTNATLIRLGLSAVSKRVSVKNPGSFEDVRYQFYDCTSRIYEAVVRRCGEEQLGVDSVLAGEITIGNDRCMSLFDYICTQMTRYHTTANMEQATKIRISQCVKMTNVILGGMKESESEDSIQLSLEENASAKKNRTESTLNLDKMDLDKKNQGEVSKADSEEGTEEDEVKVLAENKVIRKSKRQVGYKRSLKETVETDEDFEPSFSQQRKKIKRSSALERRHKAKSFKVYTIAEVSKICDSLGLVAVPKRVQEKSPKIGSSTGPIMGGGRTSELGVTNEPSFFEEADEDFEDMVPTELPFGFKPEEMDRVPRPCPNGMEQLRPIDPPYRVINGRLEMTNKKIFDVHKYLDMACLPKQHRSHILLNDAELLFRNHCQVWWLLNYQEALNKSPEELSEALKSACPRVASSGPAVNRHLYARWLLGNTSETLCRTEVALKWSGFCIVNGVLSDIEVQGEEEHWHESDATTWKRICSPVLSSHKWMDGVMNHFKSRFSQYQELGGTDFKHIANVGTDTDDKHAENLVGRYQSTRKAMVDDLESSADTVEIARGKALFELRVGMLTSMLRLSTQDGSAKAMYTPDTGCRVLTTTLNCPRQTMHTDRHTLGYRNTIKNDTNPGYFSIGTGLDPTWLWVVEGSHRSVASCKAETIPMLGASHWADRASVPPYSVFLGRADVQHAGPGSDDYPCLVSPKHRLHLYIFPKDARFPNAIHILPNYHPNFRATGNFSEDDSIDEECIQQDSTDDDSDNNHGYHSDAPKQAPNRMSTDEDTDNN